MSVCLSQRRKRSAKPREFISGESLRFNLVQVHLFLRVLVLHMLACRSVFARGYPTRERTGLLPTLWCDWWFAVIVDGLMEAALLLLVGGLIHHSPVQVCHRHLASSHPIQLLILSLHHLLPFTPQTGHL